MIKKLTNIKLNHTKIEIDGRDSLIRVSGVFLEDALLFDERYILLFITEDCPFEETLFIYLIDTQQNRIVDKAQIGQINSPGIFTDLKICSDNTISFEFMVEGGWTLELFKTPKKSIRYLWPSAPYNKLVKRPFSLSRYFDVTPNSQ